MHITEKDIQNIVIESLYRIFGKRCLNESQQSNLGGFIKELSTIFNVKLHNYDNTFNNNRCLAYITTDTFDKNNINFVKLMEKYQVFITSIDKFDAPNGTIQVNFESKFPKNVTKSIYKNSKYLYHLTRASNIQKINNEGIIPFAANEYRKNSYPERIYLLTDKCNIQDIKAYARQLATSYILVCDIDKMGHGYEFYKDPQSVEEFAIFTDKPIPRECFEIKKIKDLQHQ